MADPSAEDLDSHVSPDYNFTDADVIIRCPTGPSWSEPDPHLFRVHKATLAALSATFNDMFDLANSPGSAAPDDAVSLPVLDVPEACGVIHMMLCFFYDETRSEKPDLITLPLARLLSLWESADKYQVHLLCDMMINEAIRRLSFCKPGSALMIYATAIKARAHASQSKERLNMLTKERTAARRQKEEQEKRCKQLEADLKQCRETLRLEVFEKKVLLEKLDALQPKTLQSKVDAKANEVKDADSEAETAIWGFVDLHQTSDWSIDEYWDGSGGWGSSTGWGTGGSTWW